MMRSQQYSKQKDILVVVRPGLQVSNPIFFPAFRQGAFPFDDIYDHISSYDNPVIQMSAYTKKLLQYAKTKSNVW